MSINGRIDALKRKHAELEDQIAAEMRSPQPDQVKITDLKKEKLKVKEELGHHAEKA